MSKATIIVGGRQPSKRSTEAPKDHYFIMSGCYPVRVSADGMDAFLIKRDGTEAPGEDAYKAAIDGTEVTEEEARSFWTRPENN